MTTPTFQELLTSQEARFTNEQLEAWAGLGPWEAGRPDMATIVDGVSSKWIYAGDTYVAVASGRASEDWDVIMNNARLIAAAPDIAAALLAERKAREVEVGELHRALGLASVAIDAAYMQSDAEWRGYDNIAGKHDKIVREGRSAIRQALKGQRDE